MAKRIISDAIIESDAFIDMSHQAQVLYLHMIMNADDEGFVDKTKRLMRLYNINEIALQELITNKFIIHFENVNVIKHWLIHNIIRKDRMHPTTWQDEKRKLTIRDGIYHLDDNMPASCGQNAGKLLANGNDNEYEYDNEYVYENEKEKIYKKEKGKETSGNMVGNEREELPPKTELVGGDEIIEIDDLARERYYAQMCKANSVDSVEVKKQEDPKVEVEEKPKEEIDIWEKLKQMDAAEYEDWPY